MNRGLDFSSRSGGRHPDVVDLEEKEEEKEEEEGEKEDRRSSDVNCSWRRPSLTCDRPQSRESSKVSSAHSDLSSEDATDNEQTPDTPEVGGESARHTINHTPSVWQSFKKVGVELNQDARKMFRYFGRKLRSRQGQRETKVKEIYLVPGEEAEEGRWARRVAGSSTSKSSSSSDPST